MTSLTPLPLVSRLSSRVIRILGCNPGVMTLQGTNTYLIGTGKRRILIDSGDEDTAPEYVNLLKDVLKKENASIEHLIITHWHHDHIGGAAAVQELVKSLFNEVPTVWKLPLSQNEHNNEEEMTSSTFKSWKALADDQIFQVPGAEVAVKHTPGHTEDHACLMMQQHANNNVIFSGDCILGETSAVFENLSDYMKSLHKILALAPQIIYPGHGPVVNDPLDRIKEYIDHRNQREMQIMQVLAQNSKPMTAMGIVGVIYKKIPESLWPAASINVTHHLEKLLKENKVKMFDHSWVLIKNKI